MEDLGSGSIIVFGYLLLDLVDNEKFVIYFIDSGVCVRIVFCELFGKDLYILDILFLYIKKK